MSPVGRPSTVSAGGSGWVPLAWLTLLGLIGLASKGATSAQPVRSYNQAAAPSQGRAEPPSGTQAGGGGTTSARRGDSAPGEPKKGGADVIAGIRGYLIGFGLAALLTAGSFALSYTHLVYGPGVPVALIVFAVAQIGIHLIFFLHLTTSPDNINNAMALVFGVLILVLLIGGTLWIMGHMNANMMPMSPRAPASQMMNMAP